MNQQAPNMCFFLAAVVVFYRKEDRDMRRHMNVLLEVDSPHLTKSDLGEVHHSSLVRIKAENDVNPDQVQDIVILNLSPLGMMPSAVFHAAPDEIEDAEVVLEDSPIN